MFKKNLFQVILLILFTVVVSCCAKQQEETLPEYIPYEEEEVPEDYPEVMFFRPNWYYGAPQEEREEEQDIFEEMNLYRSSKGLYEYEYSERLAEAARIRAGEATEVFDHKRPNHTYFWTIDKEAMDGENLVWTHDLKTCVTNWLNSPPHNALMLSDEYVAVGIGIYEYNGWYCVAAEFARQKLD